MVTRLEGGRSHPSQITIRNTSGRPAIFRISVAPGTATALGGFIQEDLGTPVTTRQLADGEEANIRVFFRLPLGSPAGPKSFQVRVEEVDTAGQSRGLALDPQTFTGLALVEEVIEVVAPIVPAPTPIDLAFQFRDLLQTPTLTLAPTQVTKPAPSRGTIIIPLSSPLPFEQSFRATLNIFLISSGFEQRLSSTTITVPRGGTELRQAFTVETAALRPTVYIFRVEVIDPTSGQLLQGFTLDQPNLTVLGLAVPVLPGAPTLNVGAPAVLLIAPDGTRRSLSQGRAGDTVTLSFPVTPTGLPAGTPVGAEVLPLRAEALLLDPTGRVIRREGSDLSPTIGQQLNVRLGPFALPASAPVGAYTAVLQITSRVAEVPLSLRFPPAPATFPVFTLIAPTAAVPGISAEQLLQALRLRVPQVQLPPGVIPSFVTPGTPITVSLPFEFPTLPAGASLPPGLPALRALVFLRGPSRRTTIQLLDTMNLQLRLGVPVRLPAVELPRGAETGGYTISVFIQDPFNPTVGGRTNYLPNFGPGIFPAGFSGAAIEVDVPPPSPTTVPLPRPPAAGTVLAQNFTFSNRSVDVLNATNIMTLGLRNNNGFPALVLARITIGLPGTNLQLGVSLHPVETFGFPLTLPPNETFSFRASPAIARTLPIGTYNVLVTIADPTILDRTISERQFGSVLTIRGTAAEPALIAPLPIPLAVPMAVPMAVPSPEPPRLELGQIILAGSRITANPAVLRRGERTTLTFFYNNGSQASGTTIINLRVLDRGGNVLSQVPRFRTSFQLRTGLGGFQVPLTAPSTLANGVYGIQLMMERPDQADPSGPTPVLETSVLPVFEIR